MTKAKGVSKQKKSAPAKKTISKSVPVSKSKFIGQSRLKKDQCNLDETIEISFGQKAARPRRKVLKMYDQQEDQLINKIQRKSGDQPSTDSKIGFASSKRVEKPSTELAKLSRKSTEQLVQENKNALDQLNSGRTSKLKFVIPVPLAPKKSS